MSWIAVGVTGASLIGGAVQANGARKSQQEANSTNQALADQKNTFDWNTYLLQRGYNANGTAKPGEIPTDASAVNTSLPLWATINGQPAEQAIINSILGIGGMGGAVPGGGADSWLSLANTTAALQANPQMRQELADMLAKGNDSRTPEQWLMDDLKAGDSNSVFIKAVQDAAGVGQPTTATSVPNAYSALQDKAVGSVNDLFDGRYLDQQLSALAPILAARQAAAQDIYDATNKSADDIYAAQDSGAHSIYDADLLSADTFQQSALQALNKALAQNGAQRARQGFVGSTSGDALTRARIMADYTQQSAGARTAAGQSLAQRLAAALSAQATTKGGAGVSRATTIGSANEQDALARLGLLTDDQNRRLAGVNLPAQLASNDLSIKQSGIAGSYAALDAMLNRLSLFKSNATPNSLVTPNIQPVANSGQVVGAGISAGADAFGSYMNNQALLKAIKGIGAKSTGSPTAADWNPYGAIL